MYRVLYRFLASLARLTVRSGRSKDLEIIVLRHQLAVLRRQVDRPDLTDADRSLLGAIAAALARPSRAGWLITPDTLLRQQRRRIVGHWTQPQRPPGRPSTSAELCRLTPPPTLPTGHTNTNQHTHNPWTHQRVPLTDTRPDQPRPGSGTHRSAS